MKQLLTLLQTLRRGAVFTLASAIMLGAVINSSLRAADVSWNNGSGSSLWNLSDMNWSTGAWNNANGEGAIFGPTGVGTVDVTSPINVNSLNFTANGYTLGGAGSLTFVNGSSTLGTGFINTATGATATTNTAINSSLGMIKLGEGTLALGGPMTFSGNGFPIAARGALPSDLIIGGGSDANNNPIYAGTIRILSSSVLPTTARLGVSNGLFDLGANNTTLGALNFVNAANNVVPFNPTTGIAGAGVFGTGPLRVTGEINTMGVIGGNFNSNTIANNLDLGGGTQIVRTASQGSFTDFRALQFTGVLSNGSLLKTFGVTLNGIMGNPDGIGLFGNNTYSGSSTFNGGRSIITGTNATSLVQVVGDRGPFAPAGSTLTLQGANGSLLSAATIQAFAGGQFIIDNTAASDLPPGGDYPPTPAAQNNDRLRDDAAIQLREGTFIYRGRSNTVASETFGSLSILGGHSNVTLATSGASGTATLTANGNLSLAPRTTLQVSSTTLGAASKFFVNGTLPASDATGILSHVVGSADFLTYNGTTGFTPFTGYATDFSTAGTNVITTAAASVASSVNINALKRSGSNALTIGAGQTLGLNSGMILNTSGTGTYTGGTIAFGSNPGVIFGGTNVFNSSLTGSAGLINANSTVTLSGDLSGLTGTISNHSATATTTLATNTFGGTLAVRWGQLNLNTSQTLAGQGAITLGASENDDHLVNNFAQVNFSGAGANAIIGRDIIVDHGSYDAAGLPTTFGFLPSLAPLSNTTGSQTLSGNITLNSPVRLQGGGGTGGTGVTNFTGNISGPAQFNLSNGRSNFSGNVGNAGGFRVGEGGFTSQATFVGTITGSAPIDIIGGNNTFIAYNSGSLPTGPVTIFDTNPSGTGITASINPLQDSTINNLINLSGTGIANVAGGVTANWNGVLSGIGGLIKTGTGTLTLGNAANSYTGGTTISGGTLVAGADGSLGIGNVSLSAASVVLTLQNGTTHNYIADTATLNIGFANDTVNLAFSGTDTIKALVINGISQATGTWGAPKSGAMHTDPVFTGSGMLNVLTQLTVSTAVSRKNHGGTDFDLPLSLSPGSPGVESRVGGGSTNDHTIIVTFNDSVALGGNPQAELIAGSGAVGSGGTPNGGAVTISGNTVTIPLTNVNNAQIVQVRLNGVNGANSFIIPMGVLAGDTTGEGSVSASDIAQTKSQSGQAVNAGNFRQDVNLSGGVNATDVALVKSASGTHLP